MMVRIAICDDLREQLELIRKAVQLYFQDKREPIEVFTYENAMDFVDAFEKKGNFDIVLLDICMPGLLGTDIAAEMRKQKSRAEIVFLSTSEEFAVEAFAVRAAHYLVKPFTQEAFAQAMDRVMDSLRQRHSGKMVFRLVGGGIQVEEINAILYIESEGHIQKVGGPFRPGNAAALGRHPGYAGIHGTGPVRIARERLRRQSVGDSPHQERIYRDPGA